MGIKESVHSNRSQIIAIVASHGASNVRLFGSVARGEEREDSDVDLLVTMKPGSSLLDIIAIKQDIEDLLERTVDVVTVDSLSSYFRDEVLKQAVDL